MRMSEITGKKDSELQKLFEAPFLATGKVDWGLPDPVINKQRLNTFLCHSPQIIFKTNAGTLYHISFNHGGEFAFVSNAQKIEYFMDYRKKVRNHLGNCATQVKVWRRTSPGGLTKRVFFEEMLGKKFDTMVSDSVQFEPGKTFWITQMNDAHTELGLFVGILINEIPYYYDSKLYPDINDWIAATDAWGQEKHNYGRLFFITKISPSNV